MNVGDLIRQLRASGVADANRQAAESGLGIGMIGQTAAEMRESILAESWMASPNVPLSSGGDTPNPSIDFVQMPFTPNIVSNPPPEEKPLPASSLLTTDPSFFFLKSP